jgi:hypothetical protein
VVLAVGCTAIAGVEDPEHTAGAVQPQTDSHPSEPATRSDAGSASTTSSPIEVDAGSDAAAPKCEPPDTTCGKDSECGCGKCNQGKHCAVSCRKAWDGCNPADDEPCCLGLYCSLGTGYPTCQACLGKNANVPFVLGHPNAKACCSGKFEWQGNSARCE